MPGGLGHRMGRAARYALSLSCACAAVGAVSQKIMPIQNHAVWGAASGFPNGFVYAITQTADGYLWIGTSTGLIRYDGLVFSFMRQMESHSTAKFPVLALATDSTGQLWVTDDLTHLFRYTGGRLAGPEPD